jgi:hypothetical protein
LGSQGQLSNQQIIFNRSSMCLIDSKKPFGDVHKLKNDNIDALVIGESIAFEPQFDNDARGDPVDDSSTRSSATSETKSREREVTMQCIDYVLTTRGGRARFNRSAHPVRSR